MPMRKTTRPDTAGLSAAGIWVRRFQSLPALADEALSLARVLQTWNLPDLMTLDHHDVWSVEISGPDLPPVWMDLVELAGQRSGSELLIANHPLSHVREEAELRILALVGKTGGLVETALVETNGQRRLLRASHGL